MHLFNSRCEKLDVFSNKHKKLLMINNIAYVRGVIVWVISNILMHTSQISLEESKLLIFLLCLHEEDHGILQKHQDWRIGLVKVRKSRHLTVPFIYTIAKYEYDLFWHFYQVQMLFSLELLLGFDFTLMFLLF